MIPTPYFIMIYRSIFYGIIILGVCFVTTTFLSTLWVIRNAIRGEPGKKNVPRGTAGYQEKHEVLKQKQKAKIIKVCGAECK